MLRSLSKTRASACLRMAISFKRSGIVGISHKEDEKRVDEEDESDGLRVAVSVEVGSVRKVLTEISFQRLGNGKRGTV
jgi:hypothetical protein